MNTEIDKNSLINPSRNYQQKLLLRKRRSQSETRVQIPLQIDNEDKIKSQTDLNNLNDTPNTQNNSHAANKIVKSFGISSGNMGGRKTTAELIKEAKTYLSDVNISGGHSGVKIVSTKRPITPRETGRLLFGKVALKGRPPSAFSMRYLKFEGNRQTKPPPILEPLKQNELLQKLQQTNEQDHILETKADNPIHLNPLVRKLPSLEEAQNGKLDKGLNTSLKADLQQNLQIENSSTEQLIEGLKKYAGLKECTEETSNCIYLVLEELYKRLSNNDRSLKRGTVLGGLYGLVECTSPKILLSVARVVLVLHVTGSNLTGACKLIFKVARNEQNDYLFHENDLLELLIDGLGKASPIDDPDACIYGYGAIRFLTTSTADSQKPSVDALTAERTKGKDQKLTKQCTLVQRIAQHGAVDLMVLHLQILNESSATKKLTGPPLHSLYQLAAALRSLADLQNNSITLRTATENGGQIKLQLACPHLIRAAELSIGELDVQANIVRTLSVLSESNDCCQVMREHVARIGMLLGPCCTLFDSSSEKLLSLFSRLGYILGNIMAKYDSARLQFYQNDVAMEYLLNVLSLYSKMPLTHGNVNGDTANDVLVKLVRVIANMSVNAEVGFGLGYTGELGGILLELLKVAVPAKNHAEGNLNAQQELLTATLGALHNLCFYQDKAVQSPETSKSKDSLKAKIPQLTIALCQVLETCIGRDDIDVEVVRVLGNLTRNEEARHYFCQHNGIAIILHCLTRNIKQDYDLRACSIGVLVNLLGDAENRTPFLKLKGSDILLLLLRGALDQDDWFLATIISQAFWNLLIDMNRNENLCDKQILDDICDLLTDALDEERIFEGCSEIDPQWEEFALVGTDLLERLHVFLEYEDYFGSEFDVSKESGKQT